MGIIANNAASIIKGINIDALHPHLNFEAVLQPSKVKEEDG